MSWQADIEQIVRWADADPRFIDRAGAHLGEEERAALKAVVRSGGDLGAVAEAVGPLVMAKLRARVPMPQRAREPVAKAWKVVKTPLAVAWSPAGIEPGAIAQEFLERYGAQIETLTGTATAAAAKAKTLVRSLKSLAASKELLEAANDLREQIGELNTIVANCTHPEEDRASWAARAEELLRESVQLIEDVRTIRQLTTDLGERLEHLANALQEWADAPPATRASQAESMAARVRAVADAAADMHEQFLGALFGRH
jgi:hypothetical protein